MSPSRQRVDRFPTQTLHFARIERPPELHGSVIALDTDDRGQTWIGVARQGYAAVGVYDGESWRSWPLHAGDLTLRFEFFQNTVIRQGRMIHALKDHAWPPLTPFDPVVCLCNQQDRALWAGTLLNGLWHSPDGDCWMQIAQPTPDEESFISALACAPDGTILAAEAGPALRGTQPIWRWDQGSWQPLEPPPHRNFRRIIKMVASGNGQIWAISFYGGLWEWNKGTWTQINQTGAKANRIPSQGLQDMCLDETQARVFVMSAHYGLAMRRAGAWIRIKSDTDTSFLGNELHGRIHIGDGKLWIGSSMTHLSWISLDDLPDAEAAS